MLKESGTSRRTTMVTDYDRGEGERRKGGIFARAKEESGSGNRVISTEVIKLRLMGE